MILTLCGFMGTGKSTVGRRLALETGFDFIDLDDYIERKTGRTVREIFSSEGECRFRELERDALREIIKKYAPENHSAGLVLALGGGTVTLPECARLIKEHTRCIYLECSKTTLVSRLAKAGGKRPLLAGKTDRELEEQIGNLMNEREHIYRSCADMTVRTDTENFREVVEQLCGLIRSCGI